MQKGETPLKRVLTTCPYCGVGCGFYLDVRDDRIVGVIPAKSNPVSKGYLCVKGWHAHEPVQHLDRLKKPLRFRGVIIGVRSILLTYASRGPCIKNRPDPIS